MKSVAFVLPGNGPERAALVERFAVKIAVGKEQGSCWAWTANKIANGYGRFHVHDGKTFRPRLAHRVAYTLHHGVIPDAMELDHLCRNRACVNPDHLEPVTAKENTRRSPIHLAARTHCPKGHPYDEENTYRSPGNPGSRDCRACLKMFKRTDEQKARRRALYATGKRNV